MFIKQLRFQPTEKTRNLGMKESDKKENEGFKRGSCVVGVGAVTRQTETTRKRNSKHVLTCYRTEQRM